MSGAYAQAAEAVCPHCGAAVCVEDNCCWHCGERLPKGKSWCPECGRRFTGGGAELPELRYGDPARRAAAGQTAGAGTGART